MQNIRSYWNSVDEERRDSVRDHEVYLIFRNEVWPSTETRVNANYGNVVHFWYTAATFNSRPEFYFASNRKSDLENLVVPNEMQTDYWDIRIKEAKLGSTQLLKGLELGLTKCAAGDSVEIFFPPKYGYGDHIVGIIPENTALHFLVKVEAVE